MRINNLYHVGTNNFKDEGMDILIGADWSIEILEALNVVEQESCSENPSFITCWINADGTIVDDIVICDGSRGKNDVPLTMEEKHIVKAFILENKLIEKGEC